MPSRALVLTAVAVVVLASAAPADAQLRAIDARALRLQGIPQEAIRIQAAQQANRQRGNRVVRRGDLSGSIVLQEDRELRRKLEGIQRTLEEGRAAEAARYLGTLLQDPSTRDFFIATSDEDRSRRSFKAELQRLISTLPEAGQQAYELQFGAAARKLLQSAVAQGDSKALEDLATRYYHTEASAQALFLLAQMHLDRGRPREAASCLMRLQAMPKLAEPFEPQLGLLIASCWARAGEPAMAIATLAYLKEHFSGATFATALQPTPRPLFDDPQQALAWLEQLFPAKTGSRRSASDWLVHLGSPSRHVTVPASRPLGAARWTLPISSDADVLSRIESEGHALAAAGGNPLPMLYPVAVGNTLLLPSDEGVQAIDIATGNLLWPVDDARDFTNAALARRIWRDAAFGSLATDGRAVYLVTGNDDVPDDSQAAPNQHVVFWGGWGGGEVEPAKATPNQLMALSIAGQGKLLWSVSGESPTHPDLADAVFLGNPLPYGGQLFVMAEDGGAIRLYCLDAENGSVQWWQELAAVEHNSANDPFRRMVGATPSISDGVVVCPTSAGGMVAVDLATRSLLWAYQYPRLNHSLTDRNHGRIATLRQGKRWLDGSAVIDQGLVLITPPESDEIHCLDLLTGDPLWVQKRQQALYLAGIYGDVAVLVEPQHVVALRLDTGKVHWKASLPDRVTGRGVLASDGQYYLPLANATIQQIDLASGQLRDAVKSVRGLVPGNLLWHEGTFISVGPTYIEAYDDHRQLQQRIAERTQQSLDDPELRFAQGRLALAAGETAAAIEHFQAAYQAAPNLRHKAALLAALQEGVRAESPQRNRWQAQLDRMLGF